MKTKIIAMLPAALITLLICGSAHAQLSNLGSRNTLEVTKPESNTLQERARSGDHLNARAISNLSRNYKGITNETWYKTSYGFVAKFNIKERKYRVDFDKNGNWLYSICSYNEDELSQELKKVVKSSYYDYRILLVQEIEMPKNNVTYIVWVDGEKEQVALRIKDGQVDEWQALPKSNTENKHTSNNHK